MTKRERKRQNYLRIHGELPPVPPRHIEGITIQLERTDGSAAPPPILTWPRGRGLAWYAPPESP